MYVDDRCLDRRRHISGVKNDQGYRPEFHITAKRAWLSRHRRFNFGRLGAFFTSTPSSTRRLLGTVLYSGNATFNVFRRGRDPGNPEDLDQRPS